MSIQWNAELTAYTDMIHIYNVGIQRSKREDSKMSDMFIEFADLTSETGNWHKVDNRYGGGIKSSIFWNGDDSYSVLTYDTEYDNPDMRIIDYRYSQAERSRIERMPVDDEWRLRWNASRGVPSRGMSFDVVRGRKFPVGMTGTVAALYAYRDRYGRPVRDYIVDSDGNRIAVENCAFRV